MMNQQETHQNKGIPIIFDVSEAYLDDQLSLDDYAKRDEILAILQNYIVGKILYEEALDAFEQFQINPTVLNTIHRILTTDMISSFEDENLNDEACHKKRKYWEYDEDIRLLAGIYHYRVENWQMVSKFVLHNKTPAQCSQRWRRQLNPHISKDLWLPEEEKNLIDLVQKYGQSSWMKISSILGNRSGVQCRCHFYKLNKQIKKNLYESSTILASFGNSIHIWLDDQNSFSNEIDAQKPDENFLSYMEESSSKISQLEEEIETLKKEKSALMQKNKIMNMNNCHLEKMITKLRNKTNLIIRNKSREITHLKEILDKIENNHVQYEEKLIGPLDLTETIITNLIHNCHIHPCARRFSDCIYNLSYVLYLHSNITYKILRPMIPLPSEQMLKKRFDPYLKYERSNLLDSNQIQVLLDEFKNELSKDEEVYATIAYYSATVDPGESNDSNLFVFNFQPLNGSIGSKIVNITSNSSGRTDQSINDVVDKVVEAGNSSNMHILFIATDGETGTNKLHSNFFDFIQSLGTTNFDDIILNIDDYEDLFPVNDWYHLLKDMRKRYSENNISMFKNSPIFNAKYLNEFLDLDELVITAKGLAAMRADLALHLFNTNNLKILENNEFCGFAFLFPYTLVTVAIQSEVLTADARYLLIKIAFNCFCEFRENAAGLRSKTSRKPPNVEVRFALNMLNMSCKRTINTLIALGYALKNFNTNLRISRLFTHTVEYIFGYMRRLSYNKDSKEIAINALAKQQISKKILKQYNLDSIHIRGRVAVSDDDIDDITDGWKIDIPQIRCDNISEEIILLMKGSIQFENTETAKLLNFICDKSPSQIPSLNTKKKKR